MKCLFCVHGCDLQEGKGGICGVRTNRGGEIVTVNYGHPVAVNVDPVEKKPLYHYLPGTNTFSVALYGCNFRCDFCQNCSITQPEYCNTISGSYLKGGFGTVVSAVEVVAAAREKDAPSISFTYSEPTVWQDYALDVAKVASQEGIKTVFVTNGYFSPTAAGDIFEQIDAFNIDLKGSASFYKQYCGGTLEPVVQNIQKGVILGKHVEVTTLVIEGIHTLEEIVETGKILQNCGVQVWHLSRFFPHYKMKDRKATSASYINSVLEEVRSKVTIPYIYGGNVRTPGITYCPSCKTQLIARGSYSDGAVLLDSFKQTEHSGTCAKCGQSIYGYF